MRGQLRREVGPQLPGDPVAGRSAFGVLLVGRPVPAVSVAGGLVVGRSVFAVLVVGPPVPVVRVAGALRLPSRLLPSHDVGDQPAVAGCVLPDGHGGLDDQRVGQQPGLHLAGFDAVTADLDLTVETAEDLQAPVGPETGPVTGPVEAGSGRTVRVGDEPCGRQAG